MGLNPRNDLWPIALLIFSAVLATWLGVAGPILDEATVGGFFSLLKQWQILLGAIIAVTALVIAVIAISRQFDRQRRFTTVNLKSREEERMENALPGLREALDLLIPLYNELQAPKAKQNPGKILQGLFNSKTETLAQLAQRRLPSADERVRREVIDILIVLRSQCMAIARAEQELKDAQAVLATIEAAPAADYERIGAAPQVAEAHVKLQMAAMGREITALGRTIKTINQRIDTYVARMNRFRRDIENFFEAS